MRQFGMLCAVALLLFVIAPSRGYSQDRDENKPKAQDQAKPQNDQPRDNGARQDENRQARPDDRARQDEARPNDNNRQTDERRQQDERNARQDRRDQDEHNRPAANRPEERQQHEQRPADNRGDRDMGRNHNRPAADRGRHIPDDQFRAHFGREHHFRVQRSEIVNVEQPVVVYGGYSWELAEPWPSDWSYDDDCYIDELNGEYFLFDVMHPGMQIAVFILE